ncbi:MAG: protein-L-isoaspartate(D-aspartate) O-methyltransferase, partial [Verrucomicrobiota bacterium]|nr:protein-L-isoaspartate(D-aspartate) O-methyltransferase [Verrucomicrobiota bacterium]
PVPIGYGQTISQPYIVGLMTQLLELRAQEKVLEIGTGSGYQAAILAQLTPNVFTIEIIPDLARAAQQRLASFGLDTKHVIEGDGYFGLESEAPFDAIIVTAAADHIPPPLIKQLKPGGRMVIPVGPVHSVQRLVVVEKDENEKTKTRSILPVQFVPLKGGSPR